MLQNRTVEEIEKIYWLKTEGKSIGFIAKEIGIKNTSVTSVLRSLKTYLDSKAFNAKERKTRTYVRAAKKIQAETARRQETAHEAVSKFCEAIEGPEKKSQKPERVEVEETQIVVGDRFERLEQSLSAFQQSISQFIEEEVGNQVGGIKEENTKLKDEVKELRSVLEPLKEEARRSNWIGELKRKFGATHVSAL